MSFVDRTLIMPTPDSPYLQQWMRCNAMVKGWLKSAMDKDIRGSVGFAITARDIWRDLEERFGKESAPRAFKIRRAVTLLRQDKGTVSTYYTKLKSLWDEMNCTTPLPMCNCQGCKCNLSKKYAELREKEQLYDFLMGLDEEFNTVKSQILSTRPIPSLGVAYHMVSEDEQQRLISSTAKHGTEMTTFHVQSRRVEKSRGEPIDNKNKQKDRPTCGHCGKFGHKEEQCFEIIGYPGTRPIGIKERVKETITTDKTWVRKLRMLVGKSGESSANPTVNMAGKLEHHETWVIDSGAIDHIVNNPTLLSKIEEGLTLEEVDWNGNQSFDLNHTSATHSQPGIIDDEYPTNFETCTTIQKEDITQIDVPSSPIVIEATHDQQPTASASPSSLETTSSTPTAVDIPAPRRSQRECRQPAHLADFRVDLPQSFDKSSKSPTSNMVYPLSSFVAYDKFSNSHRIFLTAITNHDEPKHFSQAVRHSYWREAMQTEIHALEQNGTWEIVPLPPGKKAIASKWVYKIKFKPNGEVERYKARLVAKGLSQVEGVDFHETFAPVAKLVNVRCLLAVAVKKDWDIQQLDVNNAFLHGDLHEDVYMHVPQGFAKPRDMRVFGNDKEKIQSLKAFLDDKFGIKDLGSIKFFLGIEVDRTPHGLVLSQRKYALDILAESGLEGCRPSAFPIEQNHKLRADCDGALVDASRYRRLVGRLLYLTVTRPDITYAVNILSQFVSTPRQQHMDAAYRLLRYLKNAPGQGILLSNSTELDLLAYCDADWGGCLTTRRLCTGYYITLGDSPISWRTKRQFVVSRSSAEAEYRVMAVTVSEILWLRWLLRDLCAPQSRPTTLFCDNQAAIQITTNPVFHERTKHVEMDCYFVRERVQSSEIAP
nr:Retrovirus-related Pol polyprotein from transposon RE2 [Ipomoea batatas]